MGSQRRTVTTADGRKLEVLTAGNPDGYPWLWIPGSPSAAADYPRLDDLATKLDLRIVTWSRPGYGDSSPRPLPAHGPRIIDDIPDIETILDAEGIDEFIVVGWSGGGPRALACAAMLPERCRAAATLASLAPFDADGLDWMAGMGPGNVADFAAALEGPEAYGAFKETYFLPMTAASVDQVAAGLAMLSDPVGRRRAHRGPGALVDRDDASGRRAGRDRRARRRLGPGGTVGIRRQEHRCAGRHLGGWAGRHGAFRPWQMAGGERAGCRRPPP